MSQVPRHIQEVSDGLQQVDRKLPTWVLTVTGIIQNNIQVLTNGLLQGIINLKPNNCDTNRIQLLVYEAYHPISLRINSIPRANIQNIPWSEFPSSITADMRRKIAEKVQGGGQVDPEILDEIFNG